MLFRFKFCMALTFHSEDNVLSRFNSYNFMATWCINSEKELVKMIFLIISKRDCSS